MHVSPGADYPVQHWDEEEVWEGRRVGEGREGWREGRVEGEGWEVVEERKGGQEKVWEGEGEREGVLEEGREELWRVGSRWERWVWSEGRGRVCLFGAKCCFPLSLSMYRTTEVGNFVWKLLSIIAEEENLELR